jgi:arginine:pyruvate transaminase
MTMQFSSLTERIQGRGADAWAVHVRAWADLAAGEDVIVMSVGDPDLATPPPVVEAAIGALRAGDTHYTPIRGRRDLLLAIAADHRTRSGQPVGADNVCLTAGCQNALFATALLLLDHGAEVIALEPMYVTYEASLRAPGARLVPVPCPPDLGFRPDLDALEAAITPQTRAIVFASPVNPTGVVFPRQDLARIAAIAEAHDLSVVADEVYAEVVFEGGHVAIAGLPGMAERTITLGSLSKSHAMTGWRVGWAVGPEPFIDHLGRLMLAMTYGLPGFIQEAASAALTGDRAAIRAMTAIYRRRRDVAFGRLDGVGGLRCHLPAAGMFMLVDVRGTGLDANRFALELYDEERVSVLDAGAFGPSTEGMVRLSFAIADQALAEGCERIARFARRHAGPV